MPDAPVSKWAILQQVMHHETASCPDGSRRSQMSLGHQCLALHLLFIRFCQNARNRTLLMESDLSGTRTWNDRLLEWFIATEELSGQQQIFYGVGSGGLALASIAGHVMYPLLYLFGVDYSWIATPLFVAMLAFCIACRLLARIGRFGDVRVGARLPWSQYLAAMVAMLLIGGNAALSMLGPMSEIVLAQQFELAKIYMVLSFPVFLLAGRLSFTKIGSRRTISAL